MLITDQSLALPVLTQSKFPNQTFLSYRLISVINASCWTRSGGSGAPFSLMIKTIPSGLNSLNITVSARNWSSPGSTNIAFTIHWNSSVGGV